MHPRLRAFARHGFTLQAAPARASLAMAALVALTGGSPGVTPARPDAVNELDRHETSVADVTGRLGSEAYARVVARVQRDADEELGAGRVIVLDRSRPMAAESGRLGGLLLGRQAARALPETGDRPGGFTVAVDIDDDDTPERAQRYRVAAGTVCVVAGAQPSETSDGVLGPGTRVSTADLHLWSLRRQVGQCLLPDPAAADAFAALLAERDDPDGPAAREMPGRIVDGEFSAPGTGRASLPEGADGLGWAEVAALADVAAGTAPAVPAHEPSDPSGDWSWGAPSPMR